MAISKADKNNRRKDTHDQILNVAQSIIASQGIRALSLRKISEKLGIQPPSIYTHFEGVDAIVEAVSLRAYSSFNRMQHAQTTGDPFDDLQSHIDALVQHMSTNSVYIQFILHDFGRLNDADSTLKSVDDSVDKSYANVQKMLDHGMKAGVFRKVNADTYLAYIFGAGLISLAWSGFGPKGELNPVAPVSQIKADLFIMAKAYLSI